MNGENGERLETLYRQAEGGPPPDLLAGFSDTVFSRTTRKSDAHPLYADRRLLLGGLGAAAAATVAGVALLNREKEGGEEALALAEVDLELLEELELCREFEMLEVLEALEEIENG